MKSEQPTYCSGILWNKDALSAAPFSSVNLQFIEIKYCSKKEINSIKRDKIGKCNLIPEQK